MGTPPVAPSSPPATPATPPTRPPLAAVPPSLSASPNRILFLPPRKGRAEPRSDPRNGAAAAAAAEDRESGRVSDSHVWRRAALPGVGHVANTTVFLPHENLRRGETLQRRAAGAVASHKGTESERSSLKSMHAKKKLDAKQWGGNDLDDLVSLWLGLVGGGKRVSLQRCPLNDILSKTGFDVDRC